jgi:[ribosomal protein S5]-alanine N-acetyltransferase
MYQVPLGIRGRAVGGSAACDDVAVSDVPPIATPRFELVSMSLPFMRALVARDLDAAAAEIGMPVPPDLPDDLDGFLQYRIADLSVDPDAQPWLGRAIVLREADGPRIIGTVGFHSPPGADGRVEVGYRVDPDYRRIGVASEVVRALFDWAAREHGVTRFRASISPDNVASLAIASKFGFRHVGEQIDDVDGLELVFELDGWAVTT